VTAVDRSVFWRGAAIACDSGWRVLRLSVENLLEGGGIELHADGEGHWSDPDGRVRSEFAGCIDIDISATPFTNTLPIRRLELEPGKSNEIEVVYVALFPNLVLQRAGQRYTRLEASENTRRYLYESMTTDFRAELDVDGDGIVIDYPGIWERVVRGS
jgi:uncharacterized protein